ncbi:hypothetical protein ABKV19_002221 [Rosa sericea]
MTNISKGANFLRELILNAEENEYEEGVVPEMKFVLTKEDITETGAPATLLVFNNEVGFSRENMDSICGIFHSTKKEKRQQRLSEENGSGFKSVFLVSSQPFIFSNGYRVRFQEEPDQDCGIGYIVPQWVSGHPSLSSIYDVYGLSNAYPATTVILPLKPEMVEAVREQLSQLCPETILFLSKLKRLSVRDYGSEVADRVSSFLISSVTKHKEVSSRVVQLSKKNLDDTEELCDYYLWEKEFPVKPENRFGVRMDVQSWVITIAFPSGERMRNATSSVGIFAFLPTTMVTDFPFLIQADFILNSSRDSILLDNVWNLGILNCIPSAFVNAFQSHSLCYPVGKIFEFLPAQASSIPKFKDLRESIRAELQSLMIVPCDSASRGSSRPSKLQGPSGVLHPSLDLEKYNAVLEFLGVEWANDHWYTECIQRLCSSIDEKVTGAGIISLLKCIKNLMSSSPDDPLLRDLTNSIAGRRCLKTLDWTDPYKTPEESILFDPAWESILDWTMLPTIDENFYGTDILVYKNQLRDIGVKVDPLSVCSLLYGIFSKLDGTYFENTYIKSIYTFLNKFQWRPEEPDGTKIFIDTDDYDWVDPDACVLHGDPNLRRNTYSLDEYYDEELLPLFSSVFGVKEKPSIDDYVGFWNECNAAVMGQDRQVALVESWCSFWKYVVDNWNPNFEECLRQKLTKLPATKSTSEKIYLINSTEIYESLGVRKVSESVERKENMCGGLGEVRAIYGLIGRGLIKIILGFLAGWQVCMSLEERQYAASSVVQLRTYRINKPYQFIYRLMRSGSPAVEVRVAKLVYWMKNSKQLFIDNSGYTNGKSDLEFVAAFADELAEGLLVQARHYAARETLSRIIQFGFLIDFDEEKVDGMLIRENLQLSVEDHEFVDAAAFPSSIEPGPVCGKRPSMERDQSGPSTSTSSSKKLR